MKRAAFVGIVATAAADGALTGCAKNRDAEPAPSARPKRAPVAAALVKPPRLRKGDVVGIIAPAGPLRHAEELEHARLQAEMLGLEPRFGKNISKQYGYLAGTDEMRADDFNLFAADPDVRAIFALRGGYGTMRILDDLDYGALVSDPKVILGFSDLTALLNAITSRIGLVTFHGPVAGHSTLSANLIGGIRRAVMSIRPLGVLQVPEMKRLAFGTARGRLAGGNLSVMCALSGTPYAIPCTGKILVLEDVHEAPYRVDRMLTQLRLNGDLERCAGIALGRFQDCVAKTDDLPSLTVEQTLSDRLADLGKPIVTHVRAGHMEDQWTLPLGVMTTLDAAACSLTVEEAAVA